MFKELVVLIDETWVALAKAILPLIDELDLLRHEFVILDLIITMICGYIRDDIETNGFDTIDDQNWSDWLLKHGANPLTVSSPPAMELVNITYQFPSGDTSRSPVMAAGAYLHWNLRCLGYVGSVIWMFAAGTGETLIAPLYEVLKARGVKFAFFHKVEALRLVADGASIASVEIAVQATLKDPAKTYQPLYPVKGLPSWPKAPFYESTGRGRGAPGRQCRSGVGLDALEGAGAADIESGRRL